VPRFRFHVSTARFELQWATFRRGRRACWGYRRLVHSSVSNARVGGQFYGRLHQEKAGYGLSGKGGAARAVIKKLPIYEILFYLATVVQESIMLVLPPVAPCISRTIAIALHVHCAILARRRERMILHALAIQIRAELRVRLSLNAASSRLTPLASGKLARVFFCDDAHRKLFIHTFLHIIFGIFRPLRNIRHPPDPRFACQTPYNLGNGYIVKRSNDIASGLLAVSLYPVFTPGVDFRCRC